MTTAYDAANMMARAIFLQHYLENDTAAVDVLPNMRFGLRKGVCFENSIGDTVEVTLPTGTGEDMKIKCILMATYKEFDSATVDRYLSQNVFDDNGELVTNPEEARGIEIDLPASVKTEAGESK